MGGKKTKLVFHTRYILDFSTRSSQEVDLGPPGGKRLEAAIPLIRAREGELDLAVVELLDLWAPAFAGLNFLHPHYLWMNRRK